MNIRYRRKLEREEASKQSNKRGGNHAREQRNIYRIKNKPSTIASPVSSKSKPHRESGESMQRKHILTHFVAACAARMVAARDKLPVAGT